MVRIDENQKTVTIIKSLKPEECVSAESLPFVDEHNVLNCFNSLITVAIKEAILETTKELLESTIVYADARTIAVMDNRKRLKLLSMIDYNELCNFQMDLENNKEGDLAKMLLLSNSTDLIAAVFKAVIDFKANRRESVPAHLQKVFVNLIRDSSNA